MDMQSESVERIANIASVVMNYLFAVVDISPTQTVISSESLQPSHQLFWFRITIYLDN